VSIRDAGPAFAKGVRGERLENNGRTLTVHRPNIPEGRLEPRLTTSVATVNPGKGSPYAPLQTTRDAGESFSRAKPAAARDTAPTPTAPATVGSRPSLTPRNAPAPSPKSDPQPNRRTDDFQRGKDRGPGHSGTVAPLIIRGSDVASQPTPATSAPTKQTTPSSSLVVIGKRDAAQTRDRRPATTTAPQTRLAEVEPEDLQGRSTTPAPAPQTPVTRATPSRNQYPTYNWSPGASQSSPRQEIPRATRSPELRDYSRPAYSAPAPVQRQPAPSAPSYSPPVSAPAPAPRYDRTPTFAPPSHSPPPAPSYSPPASAPAPAPRSQPSPPSRSESGGPKGRNQ
jgi:hypothetical protein